MSALKDDIELEYLSLKEHGVEEPYVILPISLKRCLVPCRKGLCNCNATISKRFCMVMKSQEKRFLEELNQEISFLNKELNDIKKQIDE